MFQSILPSLIPICADLFSCPLTNTKQTCLRVYKEDNKSWCRRLAFQCFCGRKAAGEAALCFPATQI